MSVSITQATPARLVKLCGADLEMGNFILGLDRPLGTGYEASRRLLREMEGVSSDGSGASGLAHSTATSYYYGGTASLNGSVEAGARSQDWGRRFLLNGGCCYIDLNHLELCIPEVTNALDHIAYGRAMYLLAHRAAEAANQRLPDGCRIVVLANNSDGQDNSYGAHLNFLITRQAWENLFHRRLHYLGFLAAYQVSSIIFAGQGKLGAENGAPPVAYQLSQRADFLEVLTGIQTTFRRPIANLRDEPLCGPWRWTRAADAPSEQMARLHVICYDHNLAQAAAFLKVGVMQLILSLIEAECVDADLILEDPVDTVVRWSHDPSLRAKARLVSGREVTALELQQRFLEHVRRQAEAAQLEAFVPYARDVLELWADTLDRFARADWPGLARRVDWVLKFFLLEQARRQRPDLGWDAPELRHLEQQYSNVDPVAGAFFAYERAGLVDQWVTDSRIERSVQEAPEDTRAWTRATLLRLADPSEIESIDWDGLRFCLPNRAGSWPLYRYRSVALANPLAFTRAHLDQILPEAGGLEEALEVLGAPPEDQRRGGSAPVSGAATALLPPPATTYGPAQPTQPNGGHHGTESKE